MDMRMMSLLIARLVSGFVCVVFVELSTSSLILKAGGT